MKHETFEKVKPWLVVGVGMIGGFLLALLLDGCTPLATEYRKWGFIDFQRCFGSLEEIQTADDMQATQDLDMVVTLDGVTVHIVGDRSKFDWPAYAAPGSRVAGYASTDGWVTVLGKVVNGRVRVNQAVLGHEMTHILNFNCPDIQDPDTLDMP